ncbi:MAG: 50S ribosomal protein L25 [Thermoleophilaceae bacterium]|nr:50S ribosomal protein L25 [Thermoleophilaceae bacterium]
MADTARPSLNVEERTERGSRATRRLRRAGQVPGVLYGGSHDQTVTFKVGHRDLRSVLVDGSALIDVKIGGERSVPAILKEQQVHPVRGDVMHVDFLEVRLDQKIHAVVAVELEGIDEAPGVKEGGVLDQITRELNIEALPTDIPESVLVDVSHMDIGSTLTLSEVSVKAGVEFLDDPEETTIATVVPPTVEEEPEIEEETALVGEDGEPAAEGDEESDDASSGDPE